MKTKEQILKSQEYLSYFLSEKCERLILDAMEEYAQEVVKNLNIPVAIKSVCQHCKSEPTEINTVRFWFCEKCKKAGQTVL